MKRNWNVLREQLLAVEQGREYFRANITGEVPPEPKWKDQSEAEFNKEMEAYRQLEERVFGHLELLVDNGFIEGVDISRSYESFSVSISAPRLTMAGHDLLDTMRTKTVWEKIQATAKEKRLELTFDTIKALAATIVTSLVK